MRVNVRAMGWQCEQCGTPVDVFDPMQWDDNRQELPVRYEPCGHVEGFTSERILAS